MKVCMILGEFPRFSNTFIINQMTGVLDRGVDLRILAALKGDDVVHPQYENYGLMKRAAYVYPSGGWPGRLETPLHKAKCLFRHAIRRRSDLSKTWRLLPTQSRSAKFRRLYDLSPLLSCEPFDVLHFQFGTTALRFLDGVRGGLLNGKVIVSFRGMDVTRHLEAHRDEYLQLFHHASFALPVSQHLAGVLASAGCPPEKIRVLRSGIQLDQFPWQKKELQPGAPLRLLSVARFVEKKGLVYALEALAELHRRGIPFSWEVLGDGPLRTELRNQVRSMGMADRIRLPGAVAHPEVVAAMERNDILLAPSVTAADGDQEGIPNAAKEAMASGLLVVATRHAGIPELIEHGIHGILVPERNSEAIAHVLDGLHHQPGQYAECPVKARTRIEEQYDIEQLNDELVEIYGGTG